MHRFAFVAALALLFASLCRADASPTYKSLQWGLHAIHTQQAWNLDPGRGSSVKVCVVDTGIDSSHVDLQGSVLAGANLVNPTTPTNFYDDEHHGTHVAGIIAGRGHEISGVAPRAQLLIAKVMGADGSGDYGSVSAGMMWCIHEGASVVNMSLGGGAADYDGMNAAVRYGCSLGVDFVAAAGNSSDSTPSNPAHVKSPCLVAVNSEDRDGTLSSFSSYGQNRNEITAPGSNILSTWVGNNAVGFDSGTSMATPFETGCLALLRDAGVGAEGAIADTLLTAQMPKGGEREFYGFGDLNCGAALRLASREGH